MITVQELAVTLSREVKPVLDEMGVKLIAIGIGPPERGAEFCKHTGELAHLNMLRRHGLERQGWRNGRAELRIGHVLRR